MIEVEGERGRDVEYLELLLSKSFEHRTLEFYCFGIFNISKATLIDLLFRQMLRLINLFE